MQASATSKTSPSASSKSIKMRMYLEKCQHTRTGPEKHPGPTRPATGHSGALQQAPTTRRPRASPVRSQGLSPGPPAAEEDHQSTKSRGPPPPKSPQLGGPLRPPLIPAQAGQTSPLQAARPSSHAPQGRGSHRGTGAVAGQDRRPAPQTALSPLLTPVGPRQPPPRRASSSTRPPTKA
ncbi:hypothetical protein NDU88_007058 [Pleurodeles waltl]|uniref:Uncharacterized protein n=1 Tax=Pleurodeles waltl TaxID=8319 RepID=A0AAV7VRP1_PLEWA|nr:hypothetical protein NDU88_007058 [Pleurodeles waltl]